LVEKLDNFLLFISQLIDNVIESMSETGMDRLEGLFDEIEFSIFLFSKFVVIINTS
jgi:hypothetical protein